MVPEDADAAAYRARGLRAGLLDKTKHGERRLGVANIVFNMKGLVYLDRVAPA